MRFFPFLYRIFAHEVYCEVLFVNPVHVIGKDKPKWNADRNRKRRHDPEPIHEDLPGEAENEDCLNKVSRVENP